MTTPHTPPTQAELNAWKALNKKVERTNWDESEHSAAFDRLITEVERLRAEQSEHAHNVRLLKACLTYGESPCGHSEQFAYSEDGGKNIICLMCRSKEVEELRKDKERLDKFNFLAIDYVVIAEKCGLIETGCRRIGGCLLTLGHDTCCCQTGDCDGQNYDVPNYPNDLNVIHSAIRDTIKNDDLQECFAVELCHVIEKGLECKVEELSPQQRYWLIATAEPEELCEAFIKTICPEKWKGNE